MQYRALSFIAFLALVLKAELEARIEQLGHKASWPAIIADLDALTENEIEQHDRRFLLRSAPNPPPASPCATVGITPAADGG